MINIFTHNRNFHSDELMAITLLVEYYIKDKAYSITRTRDMNIIDRAKENRDVFVIDVGFEYDSTKLNFDHHQNGANLYWDDGVSLSSCGLVWKWLKENKHLHQHMNTSMMELIENNLIKKIDAHDNGEDFWPVSEVLCGFNRKTDDDKFLDDKFKKALTTAINYYHNFLYHLKQTVSEEKVIKKAIKNSETLKDIIISDCGVKSANNLLSQHTDKKLFISPRTRNSWTITVISDNNNKNRINMPLSWRGFSEKQLKEISGIDNLIFCHKGGHMCMLEGSKEDALFIANYILNIK